jgi:hypothetical protein
LTTDEFVANQLKKEPHFGAREFYYNEWEVDKLKALLEPQPIKHSMPLTEDDIQILRNNVDYPNVKYDLKNPKDRKALKHVHDNYEALELSRQPTMQEVIAVALHGAPIEVKDNKEVLELLRSKRSESYYKTLNLHRMPKTKELNTIREAGTLSHVDSNDAVLPPRPEPNAGIILKRVPKGIRITTEKEPGSGSERKLRRASTKGAISPTAPKIHRDPALSPKPVAVNSFSVSDDDSDGPIRGPKKRSRRPSAESTSNAPNQNSEQVNRDKRSGYVDDEWDETMGKFVTQRRIFKGEWTPPPDDKPVKKSSKQLQAEALAEYKKQRALKKEGNS